MRPATSQDQESHDQDVDVADRFLVPALGQRAAHRAPDCLGDFVGIAPPRLRHRFERRRDGVAGDLIHAPAGGIGLRNADQLDLGIGDERALVA